MNKLLLLATSLISLTIQSRGAGFPVQDSALVKQAVYSDSTIKDDELADPKSGFKNLFETETSNGINIAKLNPQAISFVQDYIEDHTERLNKMKTWGKPYFDMINTVLLQHGLPVELKYLSVIESDLKSGAVSWAGAVGPWQLMPQTARDLGLKVNKSRDERRDYYKSTHAAAKYLSELYGIYNDWLLVIAAYNTGPGNVNSAIRRSGSRNFWDLQGYLPAETRSHVKKFIATHYIMEGDGGLVTLTKKETDGLVLTSSIQSSYASVGSVTLTGRFTSGAIADGVQMNLAAFSKLNPNFDKALSMNGTYELRLPNDKLALFQANRSLILEQSIRNMLTATR